MKLATKRELQRKRHQEMNPQRKENCNENGIKK